MERMVLVLFALALIAAAPIAAQAADWADEAQRAAGVFQAWRGALNGLGSGSGCVPNYQGGYFGRGYTFGYSTANGYNTPCVAPPPPPPQASPQGYHYWDGYGWRFQPNPHYFQQASQPAVMAGPAYPTVSQPAPAAPSAPACGWAQRTDGRGYYWQEYLCR